MIINRKVVGGDGSILTLPYQVRLGGSVNPVSTVFAVKLQWKWLDATFGAGVIIRKKLGNYPDHIADGKLVCTIGNTSTTSFDDADFDVDDPTQVGTLQTPVNWYYRAFPINSSGQEQSYIKPSENLGVATIGVYTIEAATFLGTLLVWTEVEFGRYGATPLVWDVASVFDNVSGQDDRVQILGHKSYFDNKCWDAPEPSNPNSDRKNYGNNRTLYSNMRQWINSPLAANNWFTAQHDYDVCDTTLEGMNGFLYGFTASERSLIIPETHTMRVPDIDGGGTETMIDTVWLPSRVEMGDTASDATGEGTRFQMFDGEYNTNAYRRKNWETTYWLRSAYVDSPRRAWVITKSGVINADSSVLNQYAVRPGLSLPLSTPVVFDEVNMRYKVQVA